MRSAYTQVEWSVMKANCVVKLRLLTQNPFLPADVKAEAVKRWSIYEEAADNALDLIQKGYSLEDTAVMVSDFLTWKLGDA